MEKFGSQWEALVFPEFSLFMQRNGTMLAATNGQPGKDEKQLVINIILKILFCSYLILILFLLWREFFSIVGRAAF